MAKIEFEDKVALIENPSIPDINKVKSDDMNEIKSVVNENDDKFLTNGLNISNEVDEDYRVNLLETKNICSGIELGNINSSGVPYADNNSIRSANYDLVKPSTEYVVSNNGTAIACNVSEYSSNETFIQRTYQSTGVFTTSSTTAYVKIQYAGTLNDSIQIEEGNTPTTYTPFVTNQILVNNEKYTDTLNVGQLDSRSRVNFLKSKNLLFKLPTTNTQNGITFTNNGDGTFNVSGTASAQAFFYFYATYNELGLSNGKTYTLSSNKAFPTGLYFQFEDYQGEGTWKSSLLQIDNTQQTKTSSITLAGDRIRVGVRISNGATVNISNVGIILNSGSQIDYEPYITPSIYVDDEEIYSKDNLEQYSTSEIRIGTWIDGKPLYRKVVNFGALPNATQKVINHGIANIKYITNVRGICTDGTYYLPLPAVSTVAANNTNLFASNTQIGINTGMDRSTYTGYVVLEYTKTTD